MLRRTFKASSPLQSTTANSEIIVAHAYDASGSLIGSSDVTATIEDAGTQLPITGGAIYLSRAADDALFRRRNRRSRVLCCDVCPG